MDQRDYRKHDRDTVKQNRGQHTPSSAHLLPSISHSNSNRLIIKKSCSLQNREKTNTSFKKYNNKLNQDKTQKDLMKNNTYSHRHRISENKKESKRVFRFRILQLDYLCNISLTYSCFLCFFLSNKFYD